MIAYRLGDAVATRRAGWTAAVEAATSLAPAIFALVLWNKVAWQPTRAFWGIAAAVAFLLVVRGAFAYATTRKRLRELIVLVSDDQIRVESAQSACAIGSASVSRIVEIDGALGGLRVESKPDPQNGTVSVVQVPRGGEAFGDVRARLERWISIERRDRRRPAVRLAVGATVIAGIFFVPFLLDDFFARSRMLAAALVAGMWLVMRGILRKG